MSDQVNTADATIGMKWNKLKLDPFFHILIVFSVVVLALSAEDRADLVNAIKVPAYLNHKSH